MNFSIYGKIRPPENAHAFPLASRGVANHVFAASKKTGSRRPPRPPAARRHSTRRSWCWRLATRRPHTRSVPEPAPAPPGCEVRYPVQALAVVVGNHPRLRLPTLPLPRLWLPESPRTHGCAPVTMNWSTPSEE